ncbi:MAG: hypothetical protein RLZZ399_1509 [Verrucomicrobiota bacterium]|jgi:hypothetical protein
MSHKPWENEFRAVHARGVAAWKAGRRSPHTLFSPEDSTFLASIGCSPQELFDFIDDLQDWGEPDLETALAVQAIRRAYFLEVMAGRPSAHIASMADLPAKSAEVEGIAWLPRLIAKARLKLRGEMPPDLMYGCGGDRPFLRRMRMTLAEFLQLVWDCGDDDARIVATVRKSAGLTPRR